MDENKKKPNNRLREIRTSKNLTLQQVADSIGVGNNTISRYENGTREPNIQTWYKLAKFFKVPTAYLQGIETTEFGNKLTKTIVHYHIDRSELAAESGFREPLIGMWEHGFALPDDSQINNLAHGLCILISRATGKKLDESAIVKSLNSSYMDTIGDDLTDVIVQDDELNIDASNDVKNSHFYVSLDDMLKPIDQRHKAFYLNDKKLVNDEVNTIATTLRGIIATREQNKDSNK